MRAVLMHSGLEVGHHLIHALQHTLGAVGIVLEVAQHLREVRRPARQVLAISDRQPDKFLGHDRWKRPTKVGEHLHMSGGLHGVQQAVGDILDVLAQDLYAARRECSGGQAAYPTMGRWVEKSIWRTISCASGFNYRQANLAQLLGSRRTIRGKVLENRHDIGVASDHPRVEIGIPMDRILTAQPVVEGVGVGKYLRIEQMIEAQLLVRFAYCGWASPLGIVMPISAYPASRLEGAVALRRSSCWTSSSLIVSTRSTMACSTASDISRTVGPSKSVDNGEVDSEGLSAMRAMSSAPNMEWPPMRKKLSSSPTCARFSNVDTIVGHALLDHGAGSVSTLALSRSVLAKLGVGSASRSTLPLGVNGSDSSTTIVAGII